MLQLQGIFAERENTARSRMMEKSRAALARQGQAVSTPPIGYVSVPQGKWVKDSDPRVRDTVAQIFGLYLRLGSLNKVLQHLRSDHVRFPRRLGGEVRWGRLNAPRLRDLLRN